MSIDASEYESWVGKSESATDFLTLAPLTGLAATLDKGNLKAIGQTEKIVKNYLGSIYESMRSDSNKAGYQYEKFDDKKDVELIKACVMDKTGLVRNNFSCDEPITIRLNYNVRKVIPDLFGYFEISTVDEVVVMESVSNDMEVDPINSLPVGRHYVDIIIPSRSLGHGKYYVHVNLTMHHKSIFLLDNPCRDLTFILSDDSTIRGDKRQGLLLSFLLKSLVGVFPIMFHPPGLS